MWLSHPLLSTKQLLLFCCQEWVQLFYIFVHFIQNLKKETKCKNSTCKVSQIIICFACPAGQIFHSDVHKTDISQWCTQDSYFTVMYTRQLFHSDVHKTVISVRYTRQLFHSDANKTIISKWYTQDSDVNRTVISRIFTHTHTRVISKLFMRQ